MILESSTTQPRPDASRRYVLSSLPTLFSITAKDDPGERLLVTVALASGASCAWTSSPPSATRYHRHTGVGAESGGIGGTVDVETDGPLLQQAPTAGGTENSLLAWKYPDASADWGAPHGVSGVEIYGKAAFTSR
jgi:hypothetical protein